MLRQLDRVVLSRVMARIGITVAVFFGLAILVDSLNSSKFGIMQDAGGLPLAVLAMLVAAAKWSIGTLPFMVLVGTITAVLDLQGRNELTMLKTSGMSIWRIIWPPLAAVTLIAALISTVGETWTITVDRTLPESSRRSGGTLWLQQSTGEQAYVLVAERTRRVAPELAEVTIYMSGQEPRTRIIADEARFSGDRWILGKGTIYSAEAAPQAFDTHEIATRTTRGDLDLQLSRARERTLYELFSAVGGNVGDPALRAITQTNFYRVLALPFVAAGSVLLGFALAGSYRRRRDYGTAILVGTIVGFVIYVINELSTRAGAAQVIPPFAATAGPALLSLIVGTTALLYREDGRL